jgi:hypothetical protein
VIPPDIRADLPEQVRRLLTVVVDSFEKIELLVLSWRQPDVAWTARLAAERLRLPQDDVQAAITELTTAELLAPADGGYRFAPVSAANRLAADILCHLYEDDRVLVLNVMTGLALERIRGAAATAFADGFPVRRRDPGKGGCDA